MRKKSISASRTSKKLAQKPSYSELIRKSIAAALMIGLGDYILLKVGNPIGPFLFAFGLLSVCVMGANLFTGKCGFLIEDKIKPLHLALILLGNLVAGYLFGLIFSVADTGIIAVAQDKVASWDYSWSFFIRSILCGVIMYLAVAIYRKGSKLGILFGVPLFILCGFQHCIANIITLGVAQTFSWTILLCVLGNFIGSIVTWWLCGQKS
ncbi:MAG: formate/nitrite transporter family protein [Candidatus Saccharibacteria bacterium]|nr:formate/nitrite transporter family protein [Candidatus Saccharibacteria bacterium]